MSETSRRSGAVGAAMFAGVIMVLVGLLDILQGVTAIENDNIFIHGAHYTYSFNVTAWGWIHLVIGVLVFLVGVGVLLGNTAARVVGVFIVAVSLISNFLYVPYYPFWAIVLIALDLFIIWALVVYPHPDEV